MIGTRVRLYERATLGVFYFQIETFGRRPSRSAITWKRFRNGLELGDRSTRLQTLWTSRSV